MLRGVEPPLSDCQRDELHAHIDAYVDAAKRQGWLPERVIATLKRAAHAAGFDVLVGGGHPTFQHALATTDPLLVELVGWCIARYYCGQDV